MVRNGAFARSGCAGEGSEPLRPRGAEDALPSDTASAWGDRWTERRGFAANGVAAGTDGAVPSPALGVRSLRLKDAAHAARSVGLRRVDVVAWRDLEDPEAGGSELHAHRICSLWAEAGLEVCLQTSQVVGRPRETRRNGYRVIRRGGRYAVFPARAVGGLLRRVGEADGLVEIWNGMPFFSPLWARCPRVVFLHHVHGEMWRMVLPRPLAALGWFLEHRVAPPLYRRSRVVTLSASSRREICSVLRLDPARVSVVEPGVDPRFCPGGRRAPRPLVVAVGRLVPVKRFELLVDAAAALAPLHPGLKVLIVGEGYERERLEAYVRDRGVQGIVELPGRLDDDALLELYRAAWVVASTSKREGWGMTITEAAACGTPAVATRTVGHEDAVVHGRTGLLVEDPREFAAALDTVLSDPRLRDRLGAEAWRRAQRLSWERTAAATLLALVEEARSRR
jgi:glycosyltransferase involved in cell wall biosynthesis